MVQTKFNIQYLIQTEILHLIFTILKIVFESFFKCNIGNIQIEGGPLTPQLKVKMKTNIKSEINIKNK